MHTVHYQDIAAVVSNTPMVVQDPTRENVLAHQRVNETVMQKHTVIPMSFGTVFKTDDDIMELLRSAYDAFSDVLNKMQDKFEFGLKVLWDRDQIIREIEEEDEDIRRLKSEISSQKGSTYFARMQYGRLIDAALQSRSERYVAEIFDALRSVSVASRSNKPIGDRMIMNAAFLVSREMEQPFDARVKEIGQQYEKLTFKYTGPVAAVQLRQHPPEARAGALSGTGSWTKDRRDQTPMLIVDSLLVSGIRFVLDKVAAAVETEMNDDTALRERLLAAQMQLELGEMTSGGVRRAGGGHPRAHPRDPGAPARRLMPRPSRRRT